MAQHEAVQRPIATNGGSDAIYDPTSPWLDYAAAAGAAEISGAFRALYGTYRVLGNLFSNSSGTAANTPTIANISPKIEAQMASRGWTTITINEVVADPAATSPAFSRLTGNAATAYFNTYGGYVVVDNVTGDVVQISNLNDPNWMPDSSITDPPK